MRSAPSLPWIPLLAAVLVGPAQALHALPSAFAAGAREHPRFDGERVQEPAQDPAVPGPGWSRERALVEQALAALERSDYPAAREGAAQAIDALLSRPESERREGWLDLLEDAGQAAWDAQDAGSAKLAWEQVLEAYSRTFPEDHPQIQRVRGDLALSIKFLGDLHGALALQERVFETYLRTLPGDHPELQTARGNLARTLQALGDLHGARALQEAVLEALSRTLPWDHPHLQAARLNLSGTLRSLGDLHGARALQEALLEVHSRTLPGDHPDLQRARQNLAATMLGLGELHGARTLAEAALEVRSRILPADHPELQVARGFLAVTMAAMGDLPGARALQEAVLEVRARTLPEDHPSLQAARSDLASTMWSSGDLSGARALQEAVLAARARTLPGDHPELQTARSNLALTMWSSGDLVGARALQEAVLEARSRTLPGDHPDLQRARNNLAATLWSSGDLDGARALQEAVLEVLSRTLPGDHPALQTARGNLAGTLARLAADAARTGVSTEQVEQDWSRGLTLVGSAARGARSAAGMTLWTASVREAEERMARGAARALGDALSFAAGLGPFEPVGGLLRQAFEISEATRAAGLAAAGLARSDIEPGARERLRAEIRAAGDELAGLARRGGTREEYHRARGRREAAERELVALARSQARGGLGALEVSVDSLAEALRPQRALVGFRRYERWWLEEVQSPEPSGEARFERQSRASLGAFVLRAEGGEPSLAFVDLGAVSEIEEAVQSWRSAIGLGGDALARSVAGAGSEARGIGFLDPPAGLGLHEASRLRRLIWDPLIAALGDAQHVVVALDDVVHLVPLDAIPLEEAGELIGDRWRLEMRLALWELLDAPRPSASQRALVSLGGASFDSQPLGFGEGGLGSLETVAEEEGTNANRQAVALLRGGAWERGFAPLPYTRREARGVAELFEEAFGGGSGDNVEGGTPARVLDRAHASREALFEAAPKARYLHVATHGWFAPESVRSWADADESSRVDGLVQRLGGEDTVRGMSPMLLCGLALAGANLPPNAVGRVPGLMTAEELSGLDLTGCELAVLSACDTNVGERRAGQGVASLQKALHMAGARSVITSLWKVPDEATAELMLDFYRRLWVEQKPKHQALWEAKLRLREAKDERGAPLYTTRDWAAWVLTGDPD